MKKVTKAKSVIAMFIISLSSYHAFCTSVAVQPVAETIRTSQPGIGNDAPEFSLPDMDGKIISLKSLKGKFIVIHFATTWCPFCNAEAPYLEQLYREYRSKGVEVLIIDVKEPRELVAEKLRSRFNLSFPILLDADGKVAASFAPPDVLPDLSRDEVMLASNLIVDPDGKIQFMSLLDSQNFDAKLISLKKRLDELLAGQGKKKGDLGFIRMNDSGSTHAGAGEKSTVIVSFQIKEGYHIQANKVQDENLIPAQLIMDEPEGIAFGEPVFPDHKLFRLEGTTEDLWVFDERLEIKIPVSIAQNKTPGVYLLKGNLHYQACDAWKCFFPRQQEFALQLKVD